jgi:hypothetical protein
LRKRRSWRRSDLAILAALYCAILPPSVCPHMSTKPSYPLPPPALRRHYEVIHDPSILIRRQPTLLIDPLKNALHVKPREPRASIPLLMRAMMRNHGPALPEVLLQEHLVTVPLRKHLLLDLSSSELVRGVVAIRDWYCVLVT